MRSVAVGVRRRVGSLMPERLAYYFLLWEALLKARLFAAGRARWRKRRNPLPAPLILSLTSFPPRFAMLHLTLKSLLNQTVEPDNILLWIAHEHLATLPEKVRSFTSRGISIRPCEDIGSYKKLVYALDEFPDAFIASAYDDKYYEPRWLESMVDAVQGSEMVIVCHRAHRVAVDDSGGLKSYVAWTKNVRDEAAREPSKDLLPTTGAGVLFPPRSLSSDATKRNLFQELCPTADDLWFYWMARRVGTEIKRVASEFPRIDWPTARASNLWKINREGGNDRQLRNLERSFGNPLKFK